MSYDNTIRIRVAAAVLAVVGLAGAASEGRAGMTPYNMGKKNEAKFVRVFEKTYGGQFTFDGTNFTNGIITATRVADDQDTSFSGTLLGGRVLAKYSAHRQRFGVIGSDGSYVNLMDARGRGTRVTGTTGALDLAADSFEFARAGGGKTWSSKAADNKRGEDHLLTFKVSSDAAHLASAGEANVDTYVMFWESRNLRVSDRDYNDMVVEVHVLADQPIAVPLPAAGLIGGATLIGLAICRRRRHG